MSSCFSVLISFSYFFTSFVASSVTLLCTKPKEVSQGTAPQGGYALFTLTCSSFLTRIMREANLSVEVVSSKCFTSAQMQATIRVLQLPPRASFST